MRMSLIAACALSGDTHTSHGARKVRNQSAAHKRESTLGRQPRRRNHRLSAFGAFCRMDCLRVRLTCALVCPNQRIRSTSVFTHNKAT